MKWFRKFSPCGTAGISRGNTDCSPIRLFTVYNMLQNRLVSNFVPRMKMCFHVELVSASQERFKRILFQTTPKDSEEERRRFRRQSEKEGVLQDLIVYDALVNILRTISSNVSNSLFFS
jgi:hypothetical protein